MVVVRVSPGLANQMYEFMSAYALAKELGQELVADIAECVDAAWDYCLDYFNIPNVKKIVYHTKDARYIGHVDTRGIPAALREGMVILTEQENGNDCFIYKNLDMARELQGEVNVYMCGYFSDRDRYYLKYWDEIREMFRLKEETAEISHIKRLIKDKTSVGVHIRRGDMLLAEWAVEMEDDFYRAAIECCREHFEDCVFLIFSDDIEYAKGMLGQDDSLYYVHFLGYSDADLNEFVSLSLCDHRIMSNSSTFSRLADELNWKEERKTFWKDTERKDGEELQSNINFEKRNIRLNAFDIQMYSGRYVIHKRSDLDQYAQLQREILDSRVDEYNYGKLLDKICRCSLNVFHQNITIEKELTYQKFLCLIRQKQYSNALQAAFKLYHDYSSEQEFCEGFIEALLYFGNYEEAAIEEAGRGLAALTFSADDAETDVYCKRIFEKCKKKKAHFIIVPYVSMFASGRITSLVELGLVLQHLGHEVTFVFSPIGNEVDYIRRNKFLTNRHEVCLGCGQYLLEDVQKKGISNFLNDSFRGDIVIISRRASFFVDRKEYRNGNMKYVFPDFSDNRDAEAAGSREMDRKELECLYNRADLVLTKQKIKGNGNQKIVNWEDNDSQEAYYIVKERWELGREHRLSKRAMGMAADLLDNL